MMKSLQKIMFCGALALPLLGQRPAFDPRSMIVVGDGIAAGMNDFALRETYQKQSFPALVAAQLKTAMALPLIEAPGLGSVPGFPSLPVRLPGPSQTTVRTQFPPPLFVQNLSVPGAKLTDVLTRKPGWPLIQADPQQTLTNMILGYPALILGNDKPLWTAADYAEQMAPTFVIVSLGYSEFLDAAASGDIRLLPDLATAKTNMTLILKRMKDTQAKVIVLNVPDPLDTAFFTTLAGATNIVGATPAQLQRVFGFRSDDVLTVQGVTTVARMLRQGSVGTLPAGSVISGASAAAISASVRSYNAMIATAVQDLGLKSWDMNALIRSLRVNGLTVGNNLYTADYMGGLYTLSGFYPGNTVQALIANGIIATLNSSFGTSYPTVTVATIAGGDPATRFISPQLRRPVAPIEVSQ
jgi:hypothetical protein